MTSNGLLQVTIYFVTLVALAKPLGIYIARIFENKSCWLDFIFKPIERLIYYLCGIDPPRGIRVHHKLYTGSCCSSFFVFLFNCKYTIFKKLTNKFHKNAEKTFINCFNYFGNSSSWRDFWRDKKYSFNP